MGSGICEYTYTDGEEARWVREPDGRVVYYHGDSWVFRLTPRDWISIVAAMALTPIPTDPLPIVGELVGWRCWRWYDNHLYSLTRALRWFPGEPQQGHVTDTAGGIYAFRTRSHAESEARKDSYDYPIVVGSVLLWGDVLECADGWRASHAKLRSLDSITMSDKVKKSHGTPQPPRQTTTRSFFGLVHRTTEVPQPNLPPDAAAMLRDLRAEYLEKKEE